MPVSRLSLIVAARNAAAHLPRLLASLAADPDPDREIIVCDDASTDATAAVAAAGGARVVSLPQRRGPAAARNRGAAASTGDILVFIDADAAVLPGFSAAVRERLADGSHDACICGMDLSGLRVASFATRFKTIEWSLLRNLDRTLYNCFSGNGAAIRRGVFLAVRGFNEEFRTPGVEDFDLAMRLPRSVRIWCSGRGVLRHDFGTPADEFRSTVSRAWQFACLPARRETTYSPRRRLSAAAALLAATAGGAALCRPALAPVALLAAALHCAGYHEFYSRALACGGAGFALPALAYGLALDAVAGMVFTAGRLRRLAGGGAYRFSSVIAVAESGPCA